MVFSICLWANDNGCLCVFLILPMFGEETLYFMNTNTPWVNSYLQKSKG